mgnify:CR=1 FL=1
MNGNFFTVLLVYIALAFGFLSYVNSMNENKEIDQATSTHTIPHDGDPKTNTITIALDASDFSDEDNDSLTYEWSTDDPNLKLEFPDGIDTKNSTTTTFTVGAGTYTVQLTATDTYGASTSMEKIFTIDPEKNNKPATGILESSVVNN